MSSQIEISKVFLRTHEPHEQASSCSLLDQSYEQLSAGRFSGSFDAVSGHGVTVFRETLGQTVFQTGVPEPGHITIAAAWELSGPAYWNGQHLASDSVIALTPGREFALRTPRRTVCFGVSMAPSLWQPLAPVQDPGHLEALLAHHDCWSDSSPGKRALQRRIAGLLHDARCGDAVDWEAEFSGVREMAIDYLSVVLERGGQTGPRLRADSYPRIARRARTRMLERLAQPFTVTELCLQLGCSRRSLQYAFQSVYDLTPMAYLRVLRLTAARQRLSGGMADTTVKAVAAEVGFNHLPRFAQAYTLMFGERPSQTLATGRRSHLVRPS